MEKTTSIFLGTLLGIPDVNESKTLGHKTSALSFNTKIELLFDMGALETKSKSIFRHFMSIRNQFMHNWEVNSYEKCVNNLEGLENFLMKKYPQDESIGIERKFELAISKLCDEVGKISVDLKKFAEEKFRRELERKFYKKSHQIFLDSIEEVAKHMDKIASELAESSDTIPSASIKEFGTEYHKILLKVWLAKYESLESE